ncbi:hypothetical protein COA18_04230 [Priestia megaterium]|nr:hypothetical protein COA18_04230 [Priestia megaterium]
MKGNPNDEVRFLMENPTRSDFFYVMVNVGFMCMYVLHASRVRNLLYDKRTLYAKMSDTCGKLSENNGYLIRYALFCTVSSIITFIMKAKDVNK